MTFVSNTIKVDFNREPEIKPQKLTLKSGRNIISRLKDNTELIEINESDGRILLEIKLTQAGPVISAKGAKLELSAMEEISLDAKKINIQSEDQMEIKSQGSLKIDTKENIDMNSSEDIKLTTGNMIHLN